MRMNKYNPVPMEKLNQEVAEELKDIIEEVAEQVHDKWAFSRIQDGWQRGPERNDEKKEHPSIKPYGELEEDEKKYDRVTAETVINALIAKGYKIEKSK